MSGIDCPACSGELWRIQPAAPIHDRARQSTGRDPGVYGALPCGCWLTPEQAYVVVVAYRRSNAE